MERERWRVKVDVMEGGSNSGNANTDHSLYYHRPISSVRYVSHQRTHLEAPSSTLPAEDLLLSQRPLSPPVPQQSGCVDTAIWRMRRLCYIGFSLGVFYNLNTKIEVSLSESQTEEYNKVGFFFLDKTWR